MNKLRKIMINTLCEVGKNGVGKSTAWGIYEIKIPDELKKESNRLGSINSDHKDKVSYD
ncbi:MAG: hypothetical protein K2N87_03795 [Eubacterium sp.]|nr:hypothetical protein [Eubacterium sp.]